MCVHYTLGTVWIHSSFDILYNDYSLANIQQITPLSRQVQHHAGMDYQSWHMSTLKTIAK